MTDNWRTIPLAECGNWFSGGTPSKAKPEYWVGQTPWVSPKDMDQRFIYDAIDHISTDGIENGSRLIPNGSILFVVRSMTLANRFQIAITRREVAFNQDLKAIICNSEVFPDFLFYAVSAKASYILESLVDEASHGTKRLKTDAIGNLEIPLPPLPEQHAIAHILGSLDDKIELNRRMNTTLEATARALFQSWFVDFDPVHAKARGQQPSGMDAATAALFPDHFEDSPLGPIPAGWRVGTLSDLTDMQNGYAFRSKDWQDRGIAVVKIGSISSGTDGIVDLDNVSFVDSTIASNIDNRFVLKEGNLLIGMTGAYVGRVGLVPFSTSSPLLNQRVGKFVPIYNKGRTSAFLYILTHKDEFREQVEKNAHGSAQPNISSSAILTMLSIVPPFELLNVFETLCDPLITRFLKNVSEAKTLAETRDALLPRLISGEVRVEDVDNEITAL